MKLKTGDTVKILSGKDRGRTGKISRVLPREGLIVVPGMRLAKEHRKSRRRDRKGEIILKPMAFSASQAMLICPSCATPTRVGARVMNGRKERFCKKCNASIA